MNTEGEKGVHRMEETDVLEAMGEKKYKEILAKTCCICGNQAKEEERIIQQLNCPQVHSICNACIIGQYITDVKKMPDDFAPAYYCKICRKPAKLGIT